MIQDTTQFIHDTDLVALYQSPIDTTESIALLCDANSTPVCVFSCYDTAPERDGRRNPEQCQGIVVPSSQSWTLYFSNSNTTDNWTLQTWAYTDTSGDHVVVPRVAFTKQDTEILGLQFNYVCDAVPMTPAYSNLGLIGNLELRNSSDNILGYKYIAPWMYSKQYISQHYVQSLNIKI